MTDHSTPKPAQQPLLFVEGAARELPAAAAPANAASSSDSGRAARPVARFASIQEFGEHSWAVRRMQGHRAADEIELEAATLFPADIRAQMVSAEAALGLGLERQAGEHLARARLLLTTRTHPHLRQSLTRLAIEITAMGKRTAQPRAVQRATDRRPKSAAPKPVVAAPAAPAVLSVPAAPQAEVELAFRATGMSFGPLAATDPATAFDDYRLRLAALEVLRLQSFETLLALAHVRGVDRYEYQMRTVTRVLREFFGRVLLADEVGLGKTVEACLCLKEYLLRGLVARVLILVPPALRGQWRDELANKFAIDTVAIDGDEARANPALWQQGGVLIASLGLARLEPHAGHIARESFDLVIVDEAHRLKNRRSRSWQLVDRLRSRFLLLLSATPVENDLVEIYNLLSLLKPGLFSTEAEFKRTFVGSDVAGKSKKRSVKDPLKLRALLREVMIRNTRALAEAKLPPRFATTLRATPGASEAALYADVVEAVRSAMQAGRLTRAGAGEILRAVGSSPAAAAPLVEARLTPELGQRARSLESPAKDALLVDLLARRPGEKILLFAAHISTLEHVARLVRGCGRKVAFFHGRLTSAEKEAAMAAFASECDVLVSSESGGEGFNLQFARTIVNYDLPWNPMRIEQRIGRVHRIGQLREVFIFNLVSAGTIEEEILRVLDEKINMFELVVGEVEAILGRLGDDEQEFQELVLDLYAGADGDTETRRRFDELGERMLAARHEYEGVKRLEEAAFGRDLEA